MADETENRKPTPMNSSMGKPKPMVAPDLLASIAGTGNAIHCQHSNPIASSTQRTPLRSVPPVPSFVGGRLATPALAHSRSAVQRPLPQSIPSPARQRVSNSISAIENLQKRLNAGNLTSPSAAAKRTAAPIASSATLQSVLEHMRSLISKSKYAEAESVSARTLQGPLSARAMKASEFWTLSAESASQLDCPERALSYLRRAKEQKSLPYQYIDNAIRHLFVRCGGSIDELETPPTPDRQSDTGQSIGRRPENLTPIALRLSRDFGEADSTEIEPPVCLTPRAARLQFMTSPSYKVPPVPKFRLQESPSSPIEHDDLHFPKMAPVSADRDGDEAPSPLNQVIRKLADVELSNSPSSSSSHERLLSHDKGVPVSAACAEFLDRDADDFVVDALKDMSISESPTSPPNTPVLSPQASIDQGGEIDPEATPDFAKTPLEQSPANLESTNDIAQSPEFNTPIEHRSISAFKAAERIEFSDSDDDDQDADRRPSRALLVAEEAAMMLKSELLRSSVVKEEHEDAVEEDDLGTTVELGKIGGIRSRPVAASPIRRSLRHLPHRRQSAQEAHQVLQEADFVFSPNKHIPSSQTTAVMVANKDKKKEKPEKDGGRNRDQDEQDEGGATEHKARRRSKRLMLR